VHYRRLTAEDIKDVRNLHEEWFPLNYADSFYTKIFKNNYIAIGCFAKITSLEAKTKERIEKEVILGTILIKIEIGGEDVVALYQHKDRTVGPGIGSWLRWLKSVITCREYLGAYIMTIGVVDECRRLGLGTHLLNRSIKLIN